MIAHGLVHVTLVDISGSKFLVAVVVESLPWTNKFIMCVLHIIIMQIPGAHSCFVALLAMMAGRPPMPAATKEERVEEGRRASAQAMILHSWPESPSQQARAQQRAEEEDAHRAKCQRSSQEANDCTPHARS